LGADFYQEASQQLVNGLFTLTSYPCGAHGRVPDQVFRIAGKNLSSCTDSAHFCRSPTPHQPECRHAPERTKLLERKMKSQRATPEQRRDRAELDARFGKIGISAVAAAVRYLGEVKNPAYAPVKLRPADEADDAAA
jgi:hypothetical protein